MLNHLESKNILEKKIEIDQIPGILFTPKEAENPIPTIILYHGWSSNKEMQRIRGFIFAALGYQTFIPDALYHGERNPLDNYHKENIPKYLWDVIFQSMDESSIVIDELVSKYNADLERIGVTGHSMGGFTAAGVFTHNPQLKTLAVLNGSCAWSNSNEIFKESLFQDINAYEIEYKVDIMDPMNNLQLLKDRPIILLHGQSDDVVSIKSQELFYQEAQPIYRHKNRLRIIKYLNLGHFVTTGMLEDNIIWFKKHL